MTEEDFRDLYTALRDSVFTFAVRRVGPEAAKDVVSETFEVAWRRRREAPEGQSAWAGWIVGIAESKVLQKHQRRTRTRRDDPSSPEDTGPVIDGVDGRRLYAELTMAEQRLFDVAFFGGLSVEQAAGMLSFSPGAYAARVGRLRARIARLHAEPLRASVVQEGAAS